MKVMKLWKIEAYKPELGRHSSGKRIGRIGSFHAINITIRKIAIPLVILSVLSVNAQERESAQTSELIRKLQAFELAETIRFERIIQEKRKEVVDALNEQLKVAMENKNIDKTLAIKAGIDKLTKKIERNLPVKIEALRGDWGAVYSNNYDRQFSFDGDRVNFTQKGQPGTGKIEIEDGQISGGPRSGATAVVDEGVE